MSKILDTAEAIKTHLETSFTTVEMPVIVLKQQNIASELQANLAKAGGSVLVIEFANGPNPSPEAGNIRLNVSYKLTLFAKPIILNKKAGQTPADDLVERVCIALHQWNPAPDSFQGSASQYSCDYEARVTGIKLVTNPQFLIHEISINKLIPIT